jgi:hypothetical protein
VLAPTDRPRLTSDKTMREAVLEYRDGRTRSVPVRDPAPAAIIECATLPGLTESGYERGQRRFGRARGARSDALRYVETDLIMAAFRCRACGSGPGLVYVPGVPRADKLALLHDALLTSASGVRWQLCWPCYATWACSAPARPTGTRRGGIVRRASQTFGWIRAALPKELRRAHTLIAGVGGKRV